MVMESEKKLTYGELYKQTAEMLKSQFEAGQVFHHVTNKRVHNMGEFRDKEVPEQYRRILMSLCEQRIAGVPLQYLLGEWEFFGLPFKVGKGVLIPRADTEVVVEQALILIKDVKCPVILDLCSGTGCIAVAVSHNRPDAKITALEVSEEAYPYLLKNIGLNRCPVTPVKAELSAYRHNEMLDLLVCNPPYIPTGTISSLQPEVMHEPKLALNGGDDGLGYYRKIAALYKDQIKRGGWLCFEVGRGQHTQVARILEDCGYSGIGFKNDYSGITRTVYAVRS